MPTFPKLTPLHLALLATLCSGAFSAEPPSGLDTPPEIARSLQTQLDQFQALIHTLQERAPSTPQIARLLPDVLIYHKAVDYALTYNEFYQTNQWDQAVELLQQGTARGQALLQGHAPWTTETGLVVRGYRSRIDGSAQPYGLVIPNTFQPATPHGYRLDVWLHGRDDKLTELKFIQQRQTSIGSIQPPDTFVLHPYGRLCTAFKFAGEIDVLEALDHARAHYPIDENRLTLRGFSMGGGGTWHLAVHYADLWRAAAPGAGFAETPEYLNLKLPDPKRPSYEQTLWHLYNATDHALNLFHCPTLAYSGEIDKQKQAADKMEEALLKENLRLTHIIGPGTEHKYHPWAQPEIERRIASLLQQPDDLLPPEIHFTTWTLRYPKMEWITLQQLEHHWQQARVDASITGPQTLAIQTHNIRAFTLHHPTGTSPFHPQKPVTLTLNQQILLLPSPETDRSWKIDLEKTVTGWIAHPTSNIHWPPSSDESFPPAKQPGLQGPIDDAFMDSFLFVIPSQPGFHSETDAWIQASIEQAKIQWRGQFRGEVRIKRDDEVTETDWQHHHLILWGDPASNRIIRKTLPSLPLQWTAEHILHQDNSLTGKNHLPLLIYPNPLNPNRYIVLNTGFTFTHPVSSSNADQVPKLADYAFIQIDQRPTTPTPPFNPHAGVIASGFFNEQWK